jgi:MFS family permease
MTSNPSTGASPAEKLPSGAWLVVGLLFFVGALNYIDRTLILTMRFSVIDAIPMNDAKFGLLTSVFLWTYGLLSPFGGFLADRFKRSRVIFVSLFVWSAVTWLTGYATTYNQLLISRIVLSISQACYIPAALALIADYHRGPTRSLATGIHMTGIMVGLGMSFMGGWIAEREEWNTVFLIFGIAGVIYALVVGLLLRDLPPEKRAVTADTPDDNISFFVAIKDLFSRGTFILALLYWGILGIVGSVVLGWLPTYYKEHFDLTQGIAGLYATGYLYPVAIIGLLFGGFWADWLSKKNPHLRILVPIIGISASAPFLFLASSTSVLVLAIVFFALMRMFIAFSDSNMMPILCLIADKQYRATGYGVLNFFSTILGGFGLYAAGALRDMNVGLSLMFQICALILLVCAGILVFVKLRLKKSGQTFV